MAVDWERVPWKLGGDVLHGSWVGTCSVRFGWQHAWNLELRIFSLRVLAWDLYLRSVGYDF